MKITLSADAPNDAKADLLVLAVGGENALADAAFKRVDRALGGALRALAKAEGFEGGAGDTLKLPVDGDAIAARGVLVVGLGKGAGTPDGARKLGVAVLGAMKSRKSAAIVAPKSDGATARALAEGLTLGTYRFDTYLAETAPSSKPRRSATILVGKKDAALRKAVSQGVAVAESVNFARELVNMPPNELNAERMASLAKAEATKLGLTCKVMSKAQIQRQKMDLFLAVNAGSRNEPRLIHVTYKPARPKAKVVFVGKGLTFDSGGLCLKPPKAMLDMKCDMGGAATTLGIVLAAARLKVPVEVHALVGATDNMTGEGAYRPGDIFKSRQGKTVEIINTDAEGRLVLADVLSYAVDLAPDYLVDHATLTGACLVALGPWRAAMYANDDDFGASYARAAEDAGEAFWRMPLDDELRDMLKSDNADIKHTGEAYGGSITAALFLREFIGESRWIHCDIAGPAFQQAPHGVSPKGGTGFGVATGARFLESLAG